MTSRTSRAEVLARAEAEGVDLSLLRERLRLSPTERVRQHQEALAMDEAFRNARKVTGAGRRSAPEGTRAG